MNASQCKVLMRLGVCVILYIIIYIICSQPQMCKFIVKVAEIPLILVLKLGKVNLRVVGNKQRSVCVCVKARICITKLPC